MATVNHDDDELTRGFDGGARQIRARPEPPFTLIVGIMRQPRVKVRLHQLTQRVIRRVVSAMVTAGANESGARGQRRQLGVSSTGRSHGNPNRGLRFRQAAVENA